MLRGLDASTEKFLNDLGQINRRLERAQREAGSGRRVHQVSDDPDQIANIFQLRTELEQTEQVRANLGRVKAEVDGAEQALQAAVSAMEQITTLGAQGTGPGMTAERRLIIAHQVDALLQHMAVLSGTVVEGRYVFSGDADGQLPFVLDPAFISDPSVADPIGVYQGTPASRQALHPSGSRFAIARDGGEIFDNPDPDLNVFNVINEMRAALRADDSAALAGVLGKTKAIETHLNTQLAFYGTVQNQVAEATDYGAKQELRIRTRLSEIEEADLTEALVAMNQAKYQQEVALTTDARLPKTSLFDFLG